MNEKSLKRDIFLLALPVIGENILQTLLGTVDTYFAGSLSDEAIAAIGVTNLVMNIFISFFTAVSVGTSAVVARSRGKEDAEGASRSIFHSFVLAAVLGLFTGLVCLCFSGGILRLSGAENAVMSEAVPYYTTVAVPCVFLCLQLTLSACLRALKDTKTPMYATAITNCVNIALNFIFIKLGMGILGLGLATTISRATGALLLFAALLKGRSGIGIRVFSPQWSEFKKILRIGLPAGGEKLIMRIGQLIYSSMIISIGTASYVAHSIAGSIESYSYIPAMGFGLAVCTAVGVALGQGQPSMAKRQTFAAYRMTAVIMTVIGAVFFIFARPLSALFTDTEEVIALSASVLRIIALFQPFAALVQVMTGALQGAGDTKFPMYSTFLGIWGIRLGIGSLFAFVFDMGLKGVWLAYALDVTVRGILLLVRFMRGKWQKIVI